MAADVVGPEKAIRTRSMDNVDTDRLRARLGHLGEMFKGGWNAVPDSGGRAEFGERVKETINVERALKRRGETFEPVTNGEHLKVDVHAVPVMGPRPGKKERAEQLRAREA